MSAENQTAPDVVEECGVCENFGTVVVKTSGPTAAGTEPCTDPDCPAGRRERERRRAAAPDDQLIE